MARGLDLHEQTFQPHQLVAVRFCWQRCVHRPALTQLSFQTLTHVVVAMERDRGNGWGERHDGRTANCCQGSPLMPHRSMERSFRGVDLNPPAGSDAFHLPTPAPVVLGITQGLSTADGLVHVAPIHQVSLTVWVVHQQLTLGGIPTNHQAPVTAATGCRSWAPVQPAH